jgi:hypothetical protein
VLCESAPGQVAVKACGSASERPPIKGCNDVATWASPEVVSTKKAGREEVARRLAGPEVDGVSKMSLRILSKSTKAPQKCRQTRDPKTRGQIPKRAGFSTQATLYPGSFQSSL